MVTFQVDHIIPEHLDDQHEELQSVISSYAAANRNMVLTKIVSLMDYTKFEK